VVEKKTVGGVNAVRFPIVDGDPVGVELRRRVGTPRIKWRPLILRNFLHLAVQLRGRSLIEARFADSVEDPDGLQKAKRSERIDISGVLGRIEGDLDVTLGRQVVDFVGISFLHDSDQVR